MGTALGIDDFLGDKTNAGGGGAKFLKNWKKRSPPEILVWLHTKAPIYGVWQHAWPKVQEVERDGTKVLEVWGGDFNSWEDDDTNASQRQRSKTDGRRTMPPVICPMSLMLDRVYTAIHDGKIDWVQPLFKFEGDDPAKGRLLRAGGMLGMFQDNKLSEQQKRELRGAGIRQTDAWKENTMAKRIYVFTVVDHEDPDQGIVVTSERTLLGDKMRELIAQELESKEDGKGNPLRTPWCIKWKHLPREQEFHKKYQAIRIDKHTLTPEIRALIQDTDPPDVSAKTARGRVGELRLSMETHYCGPEGFLDWDAIFGPSEKESGTELGDAKELAARDTAGLPKVDPIQTNKAKSKASKKKATKKAPEPEPEPEEEYECDHCGKMMPMDAHVCPHCGTEYEQGDDVESEPPPEVTEGGQAHSKVKF